MYIYYTSQYIYIHLINNRIKLKKKHDDERDHTAGCGYVIERGKVREVVSYRDDSASKNVFYMYV